MQHVASSGHTDNFLFYLRRFLPILSFQSCRHVVSEVLTIDVTVWPGMEFYPYNGEIFTVRISSSWSGFYAQACPVTDATYREVSKINIAIVLYSIIQVMRQCNPDH